MKLIKNLTLLLLAVFMSSCEDYLSPEPISAVVADFYYTNDQEIQAAVESLYDGLQGVNDTQSNSNHGTQVEYQLTEMRSDNTRTKASEGEPAQFESFSVEATNGVVFDYYRSVYNVIFRANTVLDNLENATPEAVGRFEGEAKFVRAYSYFNLVRLWGPVPLIDKIVAIDDYETQFGRIDVNIVYDLIVSDLETAAANLDNSNVGRASKAAAQALLAKVHLTLGNYNEARGLCESVMSAGFSLQDNFKDVFYNERNDEIIFAIEYVGDDSRDSQNFSAEWLNAVGRSSGLNYVTDEAKAALDLSGGNRTLYSYRIDSDQPSQNQVAKYIPNGDAALGIEPTAGDPRLAGNDWIVLRYADVLLMHVEAIMAGGASTADPAALSSFQKVRDRAGLTDAVASITKEELLNERRVELAFENQRWFDLLRFDVGYSILEQFAADNGYSFSATDLLLPFPQAEINLSGGLLEQNPGY
ncbi:RagB/SusD family nutrient uptake outer membrane protein [Lutimonas zeaxanthinifaciens]|uniref:RagB/SusD family nutrient uptake outer membrane protein n=1 Tax=Lutimonas zeaxanthinifaciens TaxID=3060215 RepID=UPI00265CE202|nr:RagB/SusD family nutrient uptake outer membrane protein [Lutimonas sp. YSD2104]WKK66444.1 RagB/SusD family nutrient uptake outer membrane protein [Lutimonas sp. YSD2104]